MPLLKTRSVPLLFLTTLIACSPADNQSSITDFDEAFHGTSRQFLNINPSSGQRTTGTNVITGNAFGYAVAMSNNYMIVGARDNDQIETNAGKGYVYEKEPNGQWSEKANLFPESGSIGARFGHSVAIAGEVAVVGAYLDWKGQMQTGAAYVYRRKAGIWIQEAKLVANDGQSFDLFGHSVGISQNTIIVGAFQANDNKGAAYIFDWDGSAWKETYKLIASDGYLFDGFGISVAIDNNNAVIGAESVTDLGEGSGAAYIFSREGGGWIEKQKIYSSDGCAYQFFGNPVAISGDTILSGSYLSNSDGDLNGAVYAYRLSNDIWEFEQKLTASDSGHGDGFGISLSINGPVAAIGAYCVDDMGIDTGAGYIFERTFNTWKQVFKVLPEAGLGKSEMGYSAAISPYGATFGAPSDNGKGLNAGAIYVIDFDSPLTNGEPCDLDIECESAQCCAYDLPNIYNMPDRRDRQDRLTHTEGESRGGLSGICCAAINAVGGNDSLPPTTEETPPQTNDDANRPIPESNSVDRIVLEKQYLAVGGFHCSSHTHPNHRRTDLFMLFCLGLVFTQRRYYRISFCHKHSPTKALTAKSAQHIVGD